MKVIFEEVELRPLIEKVVAETLAKIEFDRMKLGDRIAFTEPEAAALLGVRPHVLRDARLRGEIAASKAGKRLLYTRDALLRFLSRNASGRGTQ